MNRLGLIDQNLTGKLLLSGTFLACAKGKVLLDGEGRFNMPHLRSKDPEGLKDAFILFSRN
ncbi:MAG: hypothetical protein ACI9QL_004271 [Candidatus Omnitrophota bacterium]|jgi:hypothetical protein